MTFSLPLSDLDLARIGERATRNAEWAAALHILTAPCFCNDRRVWLHVSEQLDGVGFREMLEQSSWSPSERYLLDYAWSLFGGGALVDMGCLMSRLDTSRQTIAIEALQQYQAVESRPARPYLGRSSPGETAMGALPAG